MKKLFLFFTFALFSVLISPAPVSAQQEAQHVKATLISQTDYVVPGQVLTLGLRTEIEDGWHTYWVNPGDSGLETRIAFSDVPEGIKIGDLQWPIPHAIPFESLINYGYEEEVLFPIDVQIPENFSQAFLTFQADVSWLVCNEICIPEQTKVKLTLPVQNSNQPSMHFSLFKDNENNLPRLNGVKATYTKKDDNLIFKFESRENLTAADAYFFPYTWGVLVFSEPQASINKDNDLYLKAKLDGSNINKKIEGVLVIEQNGERKGYEISAEETSGLIYPEKILKAQGSPFDTMNGLDDETETKDASHSLFGFILVLLSAFLGGMILNLMPCVFPVLSMKAMSLISYADKDPREIKKSGLFYTLGILLSFGLIAAIIVSFKVSGEHIGWGFQLQSPLFVSIMALLLFLIGLNLIGFFHFGASLMGVGQNLSTQKGHKGSFWTGVLATVVATPCTAPFMATALGATLFMSAPQAFLVFIVLGLGMAFPYLLLTYNPKAFALLPKPGAWMETFKQVLAFPMFAFALWLVWVLAKQVTHEALLIFGFITLTFVFMIWLRKKYEGLIVHLVLLVLFALSVYGFMTFSTMRSHHTIGTAESSSINYEVYNNEKLQNYLAESKPVFVNMTAAWCITCLANERVALSTDDVQNAFKEKGIIYMKGDWTNFDQNITDYLKENNRTGVPLYVYYDGNGGKTILPQLLTPSIVLEQIL